MPFIVAFACLASVPSKTNVGHLTSHSPYRQGCRHCSLWLINTVRLKPKSGRKMSQRQDIRQNDPWVSGINVQKVRNSEKWSFLRYPGSKIWIFKIKNIWAPKNIWRTLEDVKSNFGQLSFSTPSWFFDSLRSYWALKNQYFGVKIFLSKYFLKILKLNNSSGSGKINLV